MVAYVLQVDPAPAGQPASAAMCFFMVLLSLSCYIHHVMSTFVLQIGAPGPALTFDFLFCPLCGSGKEGRCGNIQVMTAKPHLMHKQLQAELARSLELR